MKKLSGCDPFRQSFADSLFQIYCTAIFPDGWTEGNLTPVLKPEKPLELEHTRPITVLPRLLRVLLSVLAARVELWAGIGDFQAAYRHGRSTLDQVAILQVLAEKMLCNGKVLYASSLDYTSAFDTVVHKKLFDILRKKSASQKLLRFFTEFYRKSTNRIKWAGQLAEPYKLETGVRQGDFCSGIMFNIHLDSVMSVVSHGCTTEVTLVQNSVFGLAFADDLVMLSSCLGHLQESVDRTANFSKHHGLKMNVKKRCCIAFGEGSNSAAELNITIGSKMLPQKSTFRYLGFEFSDEVS